MCQSATELYVTGELAGVAIMMPKTPAAQAPARPGADEGRYRQLGRLSRLLSRIASGDDLSVWKAHHEQVYGST